jgi:hypothetical protein
MARHPYRTGTDARPAVDEWGIYDPSQAGLEALVERLDTKRTTAEPEARRMGSSFKVATRLAAALKRDLARKR